MDKKVMNEILNEWKERYSNQSFISDGINDQKLWNESDFKILFLLKEAYNSNKSTNSWNLSNHIKKRKAYGRTFKPLGQWAYGIRQIIFNKNIVDFLEKGEKINNALMSSAVVNIKKSNGTKKSNKTNLKMYVDNDWDLLSRQIISINPNIVICGRTFPLIKSKLTDVKKISDRVYQWNNIIFIDFWHPANRFANPINYYALSALVYKINEKHLFT
jgi:hypothetical protein